MYRVAIVILSLVLLTGCGLLKQNNNDMTEEPEKLNLNNQNIEHRENNIEDNKFIKWELLKKRLQHNMLVSKKDYHFLLIGSDERFEGEGRADTIIFVQYQPEERLIKAISFMRDSYVEIPGHNANKLNASLNIGGETLLIKTLQHNFHIPTIDYIFQVDFNGFVHIVEKIIPDGLDLEVPQELAEELNIKEGTQILKGEQLLEYVRFRNTPESDFGRVKRQQIFLEELKNKSIGQFSSPERIMQIPSIVNETSKYIDTNMNIKDWINLSILFFTNPDPQFETLTIPVGNGFENEYDQHAGAILKLNKNNNDAITEFLKNGG